MALGYFRAGFFGGVNPTLDTPQNLSESVYVESGPYYFPS
jgi:hypothetical protein